MFIRFLVIFIVLIAFVGCSSDGSDPVIKPAPYKGSMPTNFISTSASATLTNCSSPNSNGVVTFDSATYALTSGNDANHTGSAIVKKLVNNNNTLSTLITTGSIDNSGNVTGTMTDIFTINGVVDSTGSGTYTGKLSGNELIIQFELQDKTGDTCKSVGTITFVADNSIIINPGTGSGSFTISSVDLAIGSFTVTNHLTQSLGGAGTIHTFSSEPAGYPEIFTPNADIFTLSLLVAPDGIVSYVILGYFNTGSDVLILPANYMWILPCIDTLKCNTISVDGSSATFQLTDLRIATAAESGAITNMAINSLNISGSTSW